MTIPYGYLGALHLALAALVLLGRPAQGADPAGWAERVIGADLAPEAAAAEARRLDVRYPLERASLMAALEELKASSLRLALLPASLGDDEAVRAALDGLKDRLLVVPAGDHFPRPLAENTVWLRGVRVGAVSEAGLMSLSSQEGAEVDIAAPSASGTSAAAALVAAALGRALALLPGLTADEAVLLLRHTALATVNRGDVTERNGGGTVNAHKLLLVARRLAAAGWPRGREGLGNRNAPLYDFSAEGRRLEREAATATGDERLRRLRASYLLDDRESVRESLVTAHREAGLHEEASFFDALGAGRRDAIAAALGDGSAPERQLAGLRAAANMGSPGLAESVLRAELKVLMKGTSRARSRDRLLMALAVRPRGKLPAGSVNPLTAPVLLELAARLGRMALVLEVLPHVSPLDLDITPAAAEGELEIVEKLLARGAGVNGPGNESGRIPLLAVTRTRGNLAMARLLVAKGADVNRQGPSGETALLLAVTQRDEELARHLIVAKANPQLADERGRTALTIASGRRDDGMLGVLCTSASQHSVCVERAAATVARR